MSAYTVTVVSVTVACATALLITSGTRYEKLCAALTALAVALCVVSPVKELLSSDMGIRAEEITENAEAEAESAVAEECADTVARRAGAALSERFPGVTVKSLDVTVEREDDAFVVSSYRAELSGEGAATAREYLEMILGLR